MPSVAKQQQQQPPQDKKLTWKFHEGARASLSSDFQERRQGPSPPLSCDAAIAASAAAAAAVQKGRPEASPHPPHATPDAAAI